MRNECTPQFSYQQGFLQNISTGPYPCNWAANNGGDFEFTFTGSFQMVYTASLNAHQTKSVTLSYRGF